jgi:hypothetical protein
MAQHQRVAPSTFTGADSVIFSDFVCSKYRCPRHLLSGPQKCFPRLVFLPRCTSGYTCGLNRRNDDSADFGLAFFQTHMCSARRHPIHPWFPLQCSPIASRSHESSTCSPNLGKGWRPTCWAAFASERVNSRSPGKSWVPGFTSSKWWWVNS